MSVSAWLPLITHMISIRVALFLLMVIATLGVRQTAWGQPTPPADLPPRVLSAEQVINNLTQMNAERARALHAYESTRTYKVEYHGFPGGRKAEMVVNVAYRSPATKEFTIVSATGSKLLIDRVLKKILQSEQEAFATENRTRTAINHENYLFTLEGVENLPSGPCYILDAKPKTKNKFLFQGRIWVDAQQFAVARIEVQPAKNPSFWIKDTRIQEENMRVGDFWLPAHNHSVTAVRLGGHADFTIEHQNYRIIDAETLNTLSNAAPPAH
jgi:hypothetical protein